MQRCDGVMDHDGYNGKARRAKGLEAKMPRDRDADDESSGRAARAVREVDRVGVAHFACAPYK
jgi:hypothetical protein